MKKEIPDIALSDVRLKLLDPLGQAISGLQYQIKEGTKVISRGITDAEGRIQQFNTQIGKTLSVEVERFVGRGMKQIREITPWTEKFSVKLASGKVKQTATITEDKGSPGPYQRKTYTVKAGDTLDKIGKRHGISASALATLNGIAMSAIIHPGQVLKTPTQAPEENGAVPPSSPVSVETKDERGENGTPKTTASITCQGACIKLGDSGPLIEELNIRLTGFGGTISSPSKLDEFTTQTEQAIKQFQSDYMGISATGKVCGSLLLALDDFRFKYPLNLAAMKCPCGKCDGFGKGYTDSEAAGIFLDAKHTKPRKGTEYPGMHRSLLWGLRAALFYTRVKDKDLTYSFLGLSSGYRCWYNNAGYRNGHITSTKRNTTNHMGNALDVQFKKGSQSTRCAGSDVDAIREKVFVKRLGAQLGWTERNTLSLETAAEGATSWVHVDVREYEAQYKIPRYYAVTQATADGDSMVEIARREGRLALVACGGIPPTTPPARAPSADERKSASSLSISPKGIAFIKGYEKCNLTPYDDSENFCTIGWGHLIARNSCSSIKDENFYKEFKEGITQKAADRLLLNDIQATEQIVKDRVQVPMFQHEYDALVSLIFNLGSFKKCPKLLSKLNTKDYSGCCDEFGDITNGGTPGLVSRRSAEMKMFRNKVYDSAH
jgi:GH24 family phage-related lysozyme (muramidase)/LysM repeat protein